MLYDSYGSLFKNGPIPASFSIYFRLFNTLQFKLKLKKHRWCAWDLNPGQQDGRQKRIHWATAAPLKSDLIVLVVNCSADARQMALGNFP